MKNNPILSAMLIGILTAIVAILILKVLGMKNTSTIGGAIAGFVTAVVYASSKKKKK